MKKLIRFYEGVNAKLLLLITGCLLSTSSFADGALPTPPSGEDVTSNGKDFLDVIFNLFKDKIGPILIYGGAIFLVVKAMFEIMEGVKKSREKEDWSIMKGSIVASTVMVTLGLALAYVGYHIFNTMQEGTT